MSHTFLFTPLTIMPSVSLPRNKAVVLAALQVIRLLFDCCVIHVLARMKAIENYNILSNPYPSIYNHDREMFLMVI